MRPSTIAGHTAGATGFAAFWEAASSIAPGPLDWRLAAAGALPYVFAAINLVIIHANGGLDEAGARAMAGRKASPAAPVARPAVTAPARKAVAR